MREKTRMLIKNSTVRTGCYQLPPTENGEQPFLTVSPKSHVLVDKEPVHMSKELKLVRY